MHLPLHETWQNQDFDHILTDYSTLLCRCTTSHEMKNSLKKKKSALIKVTTDKMENKHGGLNLLNIPEG